MNIIKIMERFEYGLYDQEFLVIDRLIPWTMRCIKKGSIWTNENGEINLSDIYEKLSKEEVDNIVNLSCLHVKTLCGALPKNLVQLDCDNTAIKSTFSDNIKSIFFSNYEIIDLSILPGNLEVLTISQSKTIYCQNSSQKIPKIPIKLRELYCYSNPLTKLPKIPKSLKILDCHSNYIKRLPDLSKSTLSHLYCDNNEIKRISDFPNSLIVLQCGNNLLKRINLPDKLERLSCENNLLKKLPKLPETLWGINFSCNDIKKLVHVSSNLYNIMFFENNNMQRITLKLYYQMIDTDMNSELLFYNQALYMLRHRHRKIHMVTFRNYLNNYHI